MWGWKPRTLMVVLPKVRKKLSLSQLVLAGSHISKGVILWKMLNLHTRQVIQIKSLPRDRKVFSKCYMGKKLHRRVGFQCWWDWLIFTRTLTKEPIHRWPPKLLALNHSKAIYLITCKNNMLSRLSLKRTTCKTRLHIDHLTKMSWPEALRNLICSFTRSSSSVFISSVFRVTL